VQADAAVSHGPDVQAQLPQPRLGSGDADGGRAPQLQHAVEGMDSHVHLGRPVNQTIKLPRWRELASYARQFVTLCVCLGMRCRRPWFSVNGKVGTQRSEK